MPRKAWPRAARRRKKEELCWAMPRRALLGEAKKEIENCAARRHALPCGARRRLKD
jgi:hypothetical protein